MTVTSIRCSTAQAKPKPQAGKSARELLLAKMNIKRDAQRGAEKF